MPSRFWWTVQWSDGSSTRVDNAHSFKDARTKAEFKAGRTDAVDTRKFWNEAPETTYFLKRRAA